MSFYHKYKITHIIDFSGKDAEFHSASFKLSEIIEFLILTNLIFKTKIQI